MDYRPYFIDERQLEKDYLQHILLYETYTEFASDLIFKGGTALKLFYGLDRFSEDLDFTYSGEKSRKETIERFERIFKRTNMSYRIDAKKVKRRGTKTSIDFELKIEGPLYFRRKTLQNLEFNINLREKTTGAPELKSLSSRYPDIPTTGMCVMSMDEMLAEKVRAIITRRGVAARDLYDLYYLMKIKQVRPDIGLINKKLAIYGKAFSATELNLRMTGITKMEWKSELSNLVRDVPSREEYVGYLSGAFGSFGKR